MMTWRQIRDLFRRSAGTEDAHDEEYLHLNHAYRHICSRLELPELHLPNVPLTTNPGQDWLDIGADVYSIDTIIDKTTGTKLYQEPEGFRGRARFYQPGEDRPPLGIPRFWVNRGPRVWFRDTPKDERELLAAFRIHPAEIGDDDLELYPVTPDQYDMAVVKLATSNYFSLHPPMGDQGMRDYQRAAALAADVESLLAGPRAAVTEERGDARKWVRQPGYDFSLGGR